MVKKPPRCPECGKPRVRVGTPTVGNYYVDYMIECPNCGHFDVISVDKSDAEPVQITMFGAGDAKGHYDEN